MKKANLFEIYDGIYKTPILFVVGGLKEDALKEFCKLMAESYEPPRVLNSEGTTFCIPPKKGICIWLKKPNVEVLAHECFHATTEILQRSGVAPAEASNDEHYAYYFEWLFRTCNKLMKEK